MARINILSMFVKFTLLKIFPKVMLREISSVVRYYSNILSFSDTKIVIAAP